MKDWIARHPLFSFFCLAYAVSWSIAVPLALQAQGVLAWRLPWALHYLTAFGPAIAAFAIARVVRQAAGALEQPQSPSPTRSIFWWTVGFGSPLFLFALAQVAAGIVGQTAPTWRSLGHVNFLPDLGVMAWGLWFVTSGLGEEIGWRGFALPRLQRTHSAMTSTLLLSIGWAGWHLPAFFYVPSYTAIGLRILPGFFLGVLAGAIVLTWLYNTSGGSVLAAVLWHASFNLVTASPTASGLVAAVTSTLVMVWAVAVVWRCDWATLAGRSVGATREEKTRVLPGDERIPHAIDTLTHAVTIRRAPHDVWPWLVQMGAGSRAGWYSYDWLDNGRQPSATRIVPELQHPAVSGIFPALPGETNGFTLLALEPERVLILGWLSPDGATEVTWTFVLDQVAPGVTRLLVRARGGPGYRFHGLPLLLTRLAVRVVHFIMQRKQLLGIARRAEITMSQQPAFKTPEGEAAYLAAYDAAMKSWPVPYEELDLPSRFGTTHVVVCGPKDASPLVLLHGYMATVTMWSPNIVAFSKEYRVYAIDMMGQPSKSIPAQPICNTADFVSWLTATLDALHLERVFLVGMSFGGWLALNYAVAAPQRVRKLVLLSPGGLLPMVRQFAVRGMLMVFLPTRVTVNSFFRWLGITDRDFPNVLDLMYLGIKHFRMLPETARIGPSVVSDDELRTLHVPTLVLYGDHEVICDPAKALERARRLIPDFQGELVQGPCHEMCAGQHEIVDARVVDFLNDKRRSLSEPIVA